MDVKGASSISGTELQLNTGNKSNARRFQLALQDDGSFAIYTESSNFKLCVNGQYGDKAGDKEIVDRRVVKQTTCDKNKLYESQKWYFYPVEQTYDKTIVTETEYTDKGNFVSKSIDERGNETNYSYDKQKGTLQSVTNANDVATNYTYDANNNSLLSVSSSGVTNSYDYTLDELGEPLNTKTWEYNDSTWSDLLTNYNGTPITYDEIGNPLTIGEKSLTWTGRQLQSITDGDSEIAYTYNGDGLRTSKTVNGETTNYYYNGSILAGQKSGDNTLVFMYDNNSDIFGFIYNDTEYYYIKNAQNDVIAIADADGNVLVKYFYDAWGKVITVTDKDGNEITETTDELTTVDETTNTESTIVGNGVLDIPSNADETTTEPVTEEQTIEVTTEEQTTSTETDSTTTVDPQIATIADLNPILYRSYYYDKETEWYYLTSRFYNPEFCRFINSDNYALPTATPTELTDKNLFAYCDNNPVTRVDDEGTFWNFVIGAVVGAAISAASAAISGGDAKSIALSAVTGAIGGIIGASGLGMVGQIAAGAILSGGSNLANQTLVEGKSLKQLTKEDWGNVLIDATIGGVTAAVSYKITLSSSKEATKTINDGMYRYLKGEQRLIRGDRYYKGSMKRGLETMNSGFKRLNTVRGKSSAIGSSLSGFFTAVKNTFRRWFKR